jgi:hypothetical protein
MTHIVASFRLGNTLKICGKAAMLDWSVPFPNLEYALDDLGLMGTLL